MSAPSEAPGSTRELFEGSVKKIQVLLSLGVLAGSTDPVSGALRCGGPSMKSSLETVTKSSSSERGGTHPEWLFVVMFNSRLKCEHKDMTVMAVERDLYADTGAVFGLGSLLLVHTVPLSICSAAH